MAIRGFIALVLLISLAGPTSAARQGLSDEELNLESQFGAQGDHESSAAGQEGIQMQNNSLTSPTTLQIRQASATAGFGTKVHDAFALLGSVATIPNIGANIINAGVTLWRRQMELHIMSVGLCADFMHNNNNFGGQMRQVLDQVIVPALASEAAGCHACASQWGDAGCVPGQMKNGDCEKMVNIAEGWLLYMETFLHVITYLTARSDLCPSYISDIQKSWNDLTKGTQLAYGSSHYVYDFWWKDFMDHPRLEQRPASMEGVGKEMELATTWNPFRSESSLDRIIDVAIKLGIYNDRGEVSATECLPQIRRIPGSRTLPGLPARGAASGS